MLISNAFIPATTLWWLQLRNSMSFGKYYFRDMQIFQNINTFHYKISKKKLHSSIPPSISWEMSFNFWEAVKPAVKDKFSKILIFPWKLKLLATVLVGFLQSGRLCSFFRKHLPNTQCWISVISHSFKK